MLGTLMLFKHLLVQLRKTAELTQEELAEKAGIPLSSLRSHEQGQRLPSWPAVVKLAKALKVSTDVFSDCDEIAEAGKGKKKPKGKGKK